MLLGWATRHTKAAPEDRHPTAYRRLGNWVLALAVSILPAAAVTATVRFRR